MPNDIFNYEDKDYEDDNDDNYTEIADVKKHCTSCNHPNDIDSQFCSRCGKQLVKYEIDTTKPVNVIEIEGSSSIEKKEKVFFKEKGELVLKRVEHRGSGRKVAGWLVAGPIGYVLIGRDKTKKHKIAGMLTITDKAIYCLGNVYPYDHIGVISRENKSLILILDKQLDDDHFSVTLYLKTDNLKKLSAALESARTSHLC